MHGSRILIASTEPLIAALLAAWLELSGAEPVFADGTAPLADALEGRRPDLVLLDIDRNDGLSDAFLARARLARIPVVLFSPSRGRYEVEAAAKRRGLPWFPLPVDRHEFVRALTEVMAR